METTLLSGPEWAQAEFAGTQLGDKRRPKRLVKVVAALAEKPSGALNGALLTWAELHAAYRLLGRPEVTMEKVTAVHRDRTRSACEHPGQYLLVEDTTELDFTTHYATVGLGRIGDDGGRGLHMHSTMALRVEGWDKRQVPAVSIVGLFGLQCWARTMPTQGRGQEKKSRRLKRERESQRWATAVYENGGPPAGVFWTHVGDRESDIYETLLKCQQRRTDWIVRANQPRALEGEKGSVFDAVARGALLGAYTLPLRARPGQAARIATVEVRAARVTLRAPWRPDGALPPITTNVVEAREVNAPAGCDPVHWVLLTSWSVDTFAGACRVIQAYTRRWLIEEYHKALKTGVGVEESQLEDADSIRTLAGILCVVALRLLDLKLLSASQPDTPLAPEAIHPTALAILEKKFGAPAAGWTNLTIVVAIARLGGFKARKGDGSPGWISIWRGWHKLTNMVQGFLLAQGDLECV
jgi:hypothetical protein